MKTSSLCLSLFLSVALVASCSSEDDKSPGGTGGTSGKGGSGGSGSGGTSPGSGGSPGGTGGTGTGGGTGGGSGGAPGSGGSGTGGAPAGSGGAPGGDAGGGSETGGSSDMAPSAGGAGAALNNYTFDVPCPAGTVRPQGNCNIPDAMARKKTAMINFGGDPTKTYLTKLTICGVSEERPYMGCAATPMPGSPRVCVDGTPSPGGFNITYPTVSMKVSEPAHTYFLNTGNKKDDLSLIQYQATFEIKGGSTLTFETDGGSNADVYTSKFKGHNFMCAGAMITQPFEGQFFYFKVDSATAM